MAYFRTRIENELRLPRIVVVLKTCSCWQWHQRDAWRREDQPRELRRLAAGGSTEGAATLGGGRMNRGSCDAWRRQDLGGRSCTYLHNTGDCSVPIAARGLRRGNLCFYLRLPHNHADFFTVCSPHSGPCGRPGGTCSCSADISCRGPRSRPSARKHSPASLRPFPSRCYAHPPYDPPGRRSRDLGSHPGDI